MVIHIIIGTLWMAPFHWCGGNHFDLEYSSRKYFDCFFEYYMGVFQKREFGPQLEKPLFSSLFFDHILCHDYEYYINPYVEELSGRSVVDDLAGYYRIFCFYALDGAGLFLLYGCRYL